MVLPAVEVQNIVGRIVVHIAGVVPKIVDEHRSVGKALGGTVADNVTV